MPIDLAVLTPLVKLGANPNYLWSVGATDFMFEPYENDIQFDRLKHIRTMEGVPKLAQAIMRIVLTQRGDYFEDSDWGSDTNANIGTKLNNGAFATVRESIIQGLIHYNQLNQDNPNSDEIIDSIDELQVVQDENDPRTMKVVISITTESGIGLRIIAPQVDN